MKDMKTITLDDEAYTRLKAWKRKDRESFSQVVKRIVPAPGSLAAFASYVERFQTDRLPGNDTLEAAIELRTPVKSDPWKP